MLSTILTFMLAWYNLPFTFLLAVCLLMAAMQWIGLGSDHDTQAEAGGEIDADADTALDHELGGDFEHNLDHDLDGDLDHDLIMTWEKRLTSIPAAQPPQNWVSRSWPTWGLGGRRCW